MTSEARMYQKMYHILVNAVEMAILDIKGKTFQEVGENLKTALLEAEDVYILWEESEDCTVQMEQELARTRKKLGVTPDMTPEDLERLWKQRKA